MKAKLLLLLGLSLVGQVLLQDTNATTDTSSSTNATSTLLSAQDLVLVMMNFQEGLWSSSGQSQNQTSLANYQQNAQALFQVAQAFGMPIIMVTQQNQTNGEVWAQLSQNMTNVLTVNIPNPAELAVNNAQFQQLLQQSGRRGIVMAALTADYELVYNAIAAKQQGYNVFSILDSSPVYEQAAFYIASQNLMQNQLSQITWLALSKSLLASNPEVAEQLNLIYSQFIPGYPAGGEAPANDTVPPPAEETTPAAGGETTPPAGGETTPAPAETTVAPAGGETTPAPAETTAPAGGETTAPAGGETTPPVEGGRRRRLRL